MSDKPQTTFGDEEGQVCWRDGCQGVIKCHPVENCSCHINPPCSACTDPKEYCPVCDWEAEKWNGSINGFDVKQDKEGIISAWQPRPLDPRKIDYRTRSHTNSSQICTGVYPEGTTAAEVLALVKGTFGGRFNHFGNGKFEYVAYTD